MSMPLSTRLLIIIVCANACEADGSHSPDTLLQRTVMRRQKLLQCLGRMTGLIISLAAIKAVR